jgi:hypothetical protein
MWLAAAPTQHVSRQPRGALAQSTVPSVTTTNPPSAFATPRDESVFNGVPKAQYNAAAVTAAPAPAAVTAAPAPAAVTAAPAPAAVTAAATAAPALAPALAPAAAPATVTAATAPAAVTAATAPAAPAAVTAVTAAAAPAAPAAAVAGPAAASQQQATPSGISPIVRLLPLTLAAPSTGAPAAKPAESAAPAQHVQASPQAAAAEAVEVAGNSDASVWFSSVQSTARPTTVLNALPTASTAVPSTTSGLSVLPAGQSPKPSSFLDRLNATVQRVVPAATLTASSPAPPINHLTPANPSAAPLVAPPLSAAAPVAQAVLRPVYSGPLVPPMTTSSPAARPQLLAQALALQQRSMQMQARSASQSSAGLRGAVKLAPSGTPLSLPQALCMPRGVSPSSTSLQAPFSAMLSGYSSAGLNPLSHGPPAPPNLFRPPQGRLPSGVALRFVVPTGTSPSAASDVGARPPESAALQVQDQPEFIQQLLSAHSRGSPAVPLRSVSASVAPAVRVTAAAPLAVQPAAPVHTRAAAPAFGSAPATAPTATQFTPVAQLEPVRVMQVRSWLVFGFERGKTVFSMSVFVVVVVVATVAAVLYSIAHPHSAWILASPATTAAACASRASSSPRSACCDILIKVGLLCGPMPPDLLVSVELRASCSVFWWDTLFRAITPLTDTAE